MTIKEFMNLFDLKNESTVIKWIKDGYIQGAYINEESNEYFIPDLARPPYTKARAKTTNAIYKSIVKACINREGVCANLYKLNEVEFQVYIKDLADAGYIRIELHNNIEYYFATNKSNEFLKSKKPQELIKSCIGLITESAVKGITSACLEKVIA